MYSALDLGKLSDLIFPENRSSYSDCRRMGGSLVFSGSRKRSFRKKGLLTNISYRFIGLLQVFTIFAIALIIKN